MNKFLETIFCGIMTGAMIVTMIVASRALITLSWWPDTRVDFITGESDASLFGVLLRSFFLIGFIAGCVNAEEINEGEKS